VASAITLIELLKLYAEQEPHRARRGLVTIAGFDFQLRCYLAELTSELARATDVRQAGATFLEGLSDLSRAGDDCTILVQVKRTLTKARLAEAAAEAAILDEFIEREARSIHDKLRFEVVGKATNRAGALPDWDGVVLPTELECREQRQLRFERMLAEGRVLPPRLDPDPWWRIISAAWCALDDPFAFACEALEICLRRGIDPTAAERVRDEIAETFVRRRRHVHLPGQVITATEVEPEANQSQEVVLGQIPTLGHLKDGRFMDREGHVAAAVAELDRHVSDRDWRRDPYVYAFWIEGRSGNGKSVLLLQVMRHLAQDRRANVVWLDDASENLLPLLEAWAETPAAICGRCYVFIDDFYAYTKRGVVGFREIARLTRRHSRADWPILVTCGAPEQRDEWKASGDDEAFRTAHWLLKPADADEQRGLRHWYRKRTGEEPKVGTAFEQEQGLMISMMFEMRKGEMGEFGRRFRDRLEALGLVDAFSLPLALNRLYIWAPGGWLDESTSDALRRLNQDQDFSILSLSGQPGQYMRVTHPHLSDVIYHAICERSDHIVRARDLHHAFAKSLESDPPTAQLILDRVARNHERLTAVDPGELAQGMTRAWKDRGPGKASLDGLDLATMWTYWALWSARQPAVTILLGDQPVERARQALLTDHPYWGVLWEHLWSCAPGHTGLRSDAEAWLVTDIAQQSRQWSFVWEKLFDYKSTTRQPRGSLEVQATQWLRESEFEPDWNFVLRPLVAAAPDRVPWDSATRLIDALP
jgi:hypothetical protein